MRKKIKHIILVYEHIPGFAHTNRVLAYAKGYHELGLRVSVVCSSSSRYPSYILEGIDVHFCQEPNSRCKAYNVLLSYNKVIKSLKRLYNKDESVIHVYSTPTPLWISLLNKRKYDYFLEMTEIPFAITKPSIYRRIQTCLGQYKSKHCTGLLVITKSLWDYYHERGIKNVSIINMFVDTTRFDNIRVSKEKYVGYCGMVGRHKDGVEYLINSFATLHKYHPEYHLKLAGAFAYKEDEEYLRNLVSNLKLNDFVHFMGLIPSEEIPTFLSNASILALARPDNPQSRYGFPTKLGEYLYTGNPCVVTRVGELDQYLEDMQSCIFAKPNDEEDFANKLLWIVDNYDDALIIGANGRRVASNEFSYLHECEKALNFFNITVNKCQKF